IDITTAGPQDHWGAACHWSRIRYLRSGVAPNRVHLTYYGKDLDDYRPDASARLKERQRLGIADSEFIVVMVSHIYPPRRGSRRGIKGHEDFIRAIALARRAHPNVQGLVVGGPRPGAHGYFERLQRLAAEEKS